MKGLFDCRAVAMAVVILLTACGGGGAGTGNADTTPAVGWQRPVDNPLIVPKLTAATQDFGPADPSVMFDTQDNKWKIWFSSTLKERSSGMQTLTIRYCESTDGVNWSDPLTVLSVAGDANAWDHTAVETPTVIKNPDSNAPAAQKFMMWYSGANTDLATSENRPTTLPYYQIGLAYSADGKSFSRYSPGLNNQVGLVLVPSADLFGASLPGTYGDGVVADPDVIYKDGQFHMWFSSYAESVPDPVSPVGRLPLAFGISYMTSSDGVNWSAAQDNPLASLYKAGEVAGGQQPSVLFNEGTNEYEMWFSNDSATEKNSIPCSFNTVVGFWHAISNDGVNWTPDYSRRALQYDTQYGYESLGFLTGVEVVRVAGQYLAYYVAWGNEQIPDQSLYLCPDQQGALIPSVLTLNRATYVSP